MLVMSTPKLRSDLPKIGQKVEAYVDSIKHLELQMAQFSTSVNPCQSGTLPRNTIQNHKNNGHYMSITNR